MHRPFSQLARGRSYRLFSAVLIICFISSNLILPVNSYAQALPLLPAPGTMVTPTAGFTPALIKGIRVYPDNPLQFDFIVDNGDSQLKGKQLDDEAMKMIKYFLGSFFSPSSTHICQSTSLPAKER